MAVSELNNRLDYLISFSSQLVFVCSDKIQQQSKVVESFLAHQNEQADLALLTANELTPLVTYREKLFRQLISQSQTADFNRPLNQLLAPLNNHSGPILISIFQAEKLPNKLVKELWDLVLQSRFANNKQHLNILLMGLSDWAESARSSLGAKSKDQPILLNSQSDIQYSEPEELSDLESFIQSKREKFAQRLEKRHYHPPNKKWGIVTLFGLVLLVTFMAISIWQHPDKVRAIMSYIDAKLPVKEQPIQPLIASELSPPVSTEVTQPTPQPIEELAVLTNTPVVNEVRAKDILVTDWDTASANIKQQSNKILIQSSSADEQADTEAKNLREAEQRILVENSEEQTDTILIQSSSINEKADTQEELLLEPEQPIFVENLAVHKDTVNDYQIEDKVMLKSITTKEVIQSVDVAQIHTDDLFNPEPEALLALPTENFVIQIAAMANIGILQDYIRDEQLTQQIWIYKTRRYGGDWYVLLKNQHFPSIEDARAKIIYLKDAMLRNTPFVKSIGQVKQEIAISTS